MRERTKRALFTKKFNMKQLRQPGLFKNQTYNTRRPRKAEGSCAMTVIGQLIPPATPFCKRRTFVRHKVD